jgi:DNA-binding SARP family transcriptional activator/TolB-like protein
MLAARGNSVVPSPSNPASATQLRMENYRYELRILGHTELSGPNPEAVEALARQPKRLALLAYIALTTVDGFRRRDHVISLFWPELDQAQARTYLRKALYGIREALGEDLFINRGEDEIRLNHALVWCDAVALQQRARDAQWPDALSLYRGEVLDGMYPEGVAPEFQEWLDAQRRAMRELAARAAWETSTIEEARGDRGAAVAMARRAHELDPDNEEGIRRLMELLDRRGDRGGALKVYGEWQTRLMEDYGVEPAPETRKLANRVRAARKGESHETPPTPLKPTQVLPLQGVAPMTPPSTAKAKGRFASPAVVGVLVLGAVVIGSAMLWPDSPWRPRAGEHSVSVLPLRSIGGEQLQSAADAVTEELTTNLAKHTGVTVRPATRAQSLLRDGADIDKVGRRLGVAYIADGSVQGNAERIRLTIRLLRAEDAVARWANTFDFRPEDLSVVSRSVADSVAAVIQRSR